MASSLFGAFATTALVVVLMLACRANPKLFLALLRDLRPERLAHYLLMAALGVVLSKETMDTHSTAFWWRAALAVTSVTLAWIFAVMSNNFVDLEIDRVSNPTRPLLTGEVKPNEYRRWMFATLILSVAASAAAGIEVLILISLFILSYSIYSCPPFRAKRIPVFSKFFISLNSQFMVVLGFLFCGGQWEKFPVTLAFILLAGLTLGANFIDLKDVEGDRAAGIKTLPVLLGMVTAQRIMAAGVVLGYPVLIFVLRSGFSLFLAAALGIAHCYFLIRRDYSEKPVWFANLTLLSIVLIDFAVSPR